MMSQPTNPPARPPAAEILERHEACPQGVVWAKRFRTFEELWQHCRHPEWMLWSLEKAGYDNERKLRLFATACARHVERLAADERSKQVVAVAENFAAGRASREELTLAWQAGQATAADATQLPGWNAAAAAARVAAANTARDSGLDAAKDTAKDAQRAAAWDTSSQSTAADEEAWQADQFRRIFAEDLPDLLRRAEKLT